MSRILYLSAHSILEYDEVSILHELGHDVFSPGAYVEPQNPGNAYARPDVKGLRYDPYIVDQYHKIGGMYPGQDAKDYLTPEFISNFDIIIVMHMPRWIVKNWDAFKGKKVVWRTIGQSIDKVEESLKPFRDKGMKIVRYSPKEREIPGYLGEDAIIRFYKDPEEFKGWTGEKNYIVNFTQSMKSRGEHCNWQVFNLITSGLPTIVYGPNNEDLGEVSGGFLGYEDLKKELRLNRVYLYTGTQPSSYALNFIEAWMTGIPIVALGPKFTESIYKDHHLYEVSSLIQNEVNGFWSNNVDELRNYCMTLLNDSGLADKIGKAGRASAIEYFAKDKIREEWRKFIDSLA
jgi:hypothetical protein